MKRWEIRARSNKKEGEIIYWVIAAENEDAAVDKGFELMRNHPDAEKWSIFCDQYPLDTEGKEDKEAITERLFDALHMTREFMELESLTYLKDQEKVVARFKNGHEKAVNVASDSGIALISNVIKNL